MSELLEAAWDGLRAAAERSEIDAVQALGAPPPAAARTAALQSARQFVTGARARAAERGYLDAFLQEFGLANHEGIALMCLAEALLRIPDDATADRLIAEKLAAGDWSQHAGRSDSLFVNASTWGLMLTGRIVELPAELAGDTGGWLRGLVRRSGEPLVRQAMRRAMKIIGGEFVVGRTIEEALQRSQAEAPLSLCSFDMLGEGARTQREAEQYQAAYLHAIEAIGAQHVDRSLEQRSAISIKLSALEPRYALTHHATVHRNLTPRALQLVRAAAARDVGVTIDAEEADRLEISLAVIEQLARDSTTRAWAGLGLAVQAYGKRAAAVIDWVDALCRSTGRRMTLRLVKGAYWDTEIKRSQERGLPGYPVYTRKSTTDVSWLACAARLLALRERIYPQFATHNAHSIASVLALAPDARGYEFQRLHGMGVLLYDEIRRQVPQLPAVRAYAPVGEHADLLAYLVRRLIENGANTSFVNRFMDESVPVAELIQDPWSTLADPQALPHPGIALPPQLYGAARANSPGADFGLQRELQDLRAEIDAGKSRALSAGPDDGEAVAVLNPADLRDEVGQVRFASAVDVQRAFDQAHAAFPAWNSRPVAERAACLDRAANLLQARRAEYLVLLVREAGKTVPDALAEWREAIDFCRYYAAEARRTLAQPQRLLGPTGESNEWSASGRGVFVCISPWNFPLAIFAGQIVAALVTGNAVVAKPAETTSLIGAQMTALLHEAGVPLEVLHCVPMRGRLFGEAALSQAALAGVVFTGSTATALWLNRALAARDGAILPLIAETGGINAMLVDSTALPVQVVDDALTSAFGSAGQRCSALRLLCLQDDVADRILEALTGAMQDLNTGDPADLATDLGPVISADAARRLQDYIAQVGRHARVLAVGRAPTTAARGHFVLPHLIELPDARALSSEQFGPILHVVRYRADRLGELIEDLNASGYALTLGVQTRLDSTWREVWSRTRAGNTYVNRNMIGAVVGVQPFGGTGLSGTGPKAGGPHYLSRFINERTLTINTTATGGNADLLSLR
jgi:RHH-type proline utilization regulon transcriptional repressor/proline dehydrogenase/delta 1-pyrroline-5-carboxylate dehydrogenase